MCGTKIPFTSSSSSSSVNVSVPLRRRCCISWCHLAKRKTNQVFCFHFDYAKDRCHAAQVLPPSKDPKIFAQTDGISHRCGWPFAQIVALLPDWVPCRVAGVIDPRTGCSPAPPNRNILWDAAGYGQYVFLIGEMAYRVRMPSPSVQRPSAQGAWPAPPKDYESPPLVWGKWSGFNVFLYIRNIFEILHMV